MRQSKIEWTESTWNPVTGCTKLSAGCRNCYAERMAKRLQAMGQPNYRHGLKVTYGWVIVGGESGPRARPTCEQWVTDIRDQCQESNVPFFFKQWGGVRKKEAGRALNGRVWDEMPLVTN